MADEKRIYPSTPLESVVIHEEQQQKLLSSLQEPPTYDQSIRAIPTQAREHPTFVFMTQRITLPFGKEPVDMECPFCHKEMQTRIRYLPTTGTHLVAALLCLFQLYCCICLPYCMSSCMKTQHSCSNCDRYLGTY